MTDAAFRGAVFMARRDAGGCDEACAFGDVRESGEVDAVVLAMELEVVRVEEGWQPLAVSMNSEAIAKPGHEG